MPDPTEVSEAERQLEAGNFLTYVEWLSEEGSAVAREVLDMWYPGREAARLLLKRLDREACEAPGAPVRPPDAQRGTEGE